jgi:hypothetical protein
MRQVGQTKCPDGSTVPSPIPNERAFFAAHAVSPVEAGSHPYVLCFLNWTRSGTDGFLGPQSGQGRDQVMGTSLRGILDLSASSPTLGHRGSVLPR